MRFLISILVFIALMSLSLKVVAQDKDFAAFVETKSGDTIHVQKIRDHRHFWQKERRYVLRLQNGEKKKILASDVLTYGKMDRGHLVIYKIVEVQQSSGSTYLREMQIVERGKITLLREWHEGNSWLYVESPYYTGYLESKEEISNMLDYLNSCHSFKRKFKNENSVKYRSLPKVIAFYNKHCQN